MYLAQGTGPRKLHGAAQPAAEGLSLTMDGEHLWKLQGEQEQLMPPMAGAGHLPQQGEPSPRAEKLLGCWNHTQHQPSVHREAVPWLSPAG